MPSDGSREPEVAAFEFAPDPSLDYFLTPRLPPMQSRVAGSRPPAAVPRPPIYSVLLAMLATMSAVYVAGRLWQDAENRVYLIEELDRRTGQGKSAISVDDTLKVLACRDQHKKLSALEMELAAARHEGFVPKHTLESNGTHFKQRPLAVIGIFTGLGDRKNRDAIRKSCFPTRAALEKLEKDKGIIVRFIIGRSANRGDTFDRTINEESKQTDDIVIFENHVEDQKELAKKSKLFFSYAADTWDADFYVKVNDAIVVNIDAFGEMLQTYLDKPRVYIGCMKSGQVFSEQKDRWYEPEWWKFGDAKSYFRHASGEVFVISRALAQFISINRSILRTYAHDDVSVGSWLIGLDVKHIDEGKLCCSSWSTVDHSLPSDDFTIQRMASPTFKPENDILSPNTFQEPSAKPFS